MLFSVAIAFRNLRLLTRHLRLLTRPPATTTPSSQMPKLLRRQNMSCMRDAMPEALRQVQMHVAQKTTNFSQEVKMKTYGSKT